MFGKTKNDNKPGIYTLHGYLAIAGAMYNEQCKNSSQVELTQAQLGSLHVWLDTVTQKYTPDEAAKLWEQASRM